MHILIFHTHDKQDVGTEDACMHGVQPLGTSLIVQTAGLARTEPP